MVTSESHKELLIASIFPTLVPQLASHALVPPASIRHHLRQSASGSHYYTRRVLCTYEHALLPSRFQGPYTHASMLSLLPLPWQVVTPGGENDLGSDEYRLLD